jgi:hypothetical protein
MVVGAGVFAMVTFAMFGSAMIPSLSLRLPILQFPQRVPCIAKRTEVRDGFLGAGFPCSMVKGRLMSGVRRPWITTLRLIKTGPQSPIVLVLQTWD